MSKIKWVFIFAHSYLFLVEMKNNDDEDFHRFNHWQNQLEPALIKPNKLEGYNCQKS